MSTKVGLLVGDQHIVANGRPGYVKRACDASLRRLQTDVIDLYQLHRADPEVPVEETWGAMAELVAGGKGAGVGAVRGGRAGRGAGRGRAARRDGAPEYSTSGGSFKASKPRAWSPQPILDAGGPFQPYALAPDGKRFAVLLYPDGTADPRNSLHLTFVLNFVGDLRKRFSPE